MKKSWKKINKTKTKMFIQKVIQENIKFLLPMVVACKGSFKLQSLNY